MTADRPRRRWAALAVTMIVNVPVQALWIAYSPITPAAARYYGVPDLAVVALSMLFMAVYVVASIPASAVIDTRGVRFAVTTGALLVGVCGLARGLAGPSYPWALAATCGIALGQPLLLNAWTAMPAQWFAPDERAGAVGLTTVASLIGTAAGMVLPPAAVATLGVGGLQTALGAAALAAAVLFAAVYRDRRPVAEALADGGRSLVVDGIRTAFARRPFRVFLAAVFLVMGVFNALTSLTAEIIAPHGLGATVAGALGAALLTGGLVGAAALPHVSDRAGRRVPFLAGGMACAAGLLAVLALVSSPAALYAVAFALGAATVPLLPIGMAYAAEVVRPVPDGTSNGVIQIAGQASVILIGLLWVLRAPDGSFAPGLLTCAVALGAAALVVARLPEAHPSTAADTPATAHDTPSATPEARQDATDAPRDGVEAPDPRVRLHARRASRRASDAPRDLAPQPEDSAR